MPPTDDRLHRDLERLAIRGDLPLHAWSTRPVSRLELAAAGLRLDGETPSRARFRRDLARELHALGATGGPRETLPLLEVASGDRRLRFRPYVRAMPRLTLAEGDGEWDWGDSTRAGLAAALELGRDVTLSGDLFIGDVAGGRRFSDPLFAGTDVLVYTERLDLNVRTPFADFRFGRDRHRWGPGAWGNLLLDDSGAPFTFAQYDWALPPWLRFRAILGFLRQGQGLYLAAHRLTWAPSPRLEISLAEGARFQSDAPGLLYALGFIPYTFVERIEIQDSAHDSTRTRRRNNVLWSLGWTWRTSSDQAFYGEILADEIANKTGSIPSRLGFLAGYAWAPRFGGYDWTLGIEAAKVYNFTYSVYYRDFCLCDWTHQDGPLGFPDGPDVERVVLRALVDVTPVWGGDLVVTLFRHGRGRLGVPWYPAGDPRAEGQPRRAYDLWEPILYGASVRGAVRWEPRDNVGGSVGLRFDRADATRDGSGPRNAGRLDLGLHLHL
jgi:hypothetical protein